MTRVANRKVRMGGLLRQDEESSKSGISAVTNIAEADRTVVGLLGFTLGFAYGLQYSTTTPGVCYIAVEGESEAVQQILELVRVGYLPSTWS